MKKIEMKNGTEALLRDALEQDAQEVVKFYNIVGGETDFLSFGKDEFKPTVEEEAKIISDIVKADTSRMLVATLEGKIIAIATVNSGIKERSKQNGVLGIVVENEYCDQGLGRIMICELLEWAKGNGITTKISLTTRADNQRGIELYKKLGFTEEGLLIRENIINGVYYDVLCMAKFL